MPKYRLTPAAKSDLLEIWQYSVETWGETQAENYLLKIEATLEKLASNPEIGRKRPEVTPGYFSFPVEKHIIFYLCSDNYIDIIGILHGRMDIKNNLF
jgi:toxin ParE1/3/4